MSKLNQQGQFLEYNLRIEAAGEYDIAFNIASAQDEKTNMFEITVDGVKQDIVVSMEKTHEENDKSGFKAKYLANASYKVKFPTVGDVKLRFTVLGKQLISFDSFVIFNKKVSNEGITKIEAETFDKSNGESRFTVNGAATMPAQAAHRYYIYDLNVKTAGYYDLRLMVSNVKKSQKEALIIYVNDIENAKVNVKRTSLDGHNVFESNHYTYQETDSVKISLPAGNVKIKIETSDDTVSSIDYFTLRPYHEKAILKGQYQDNTDEFHYNTDLEGKKLDTLITFSDLISNHTLLDCFVSQLSIIDLTRLAGLYNENSKILTGVGGIGGFYVDSKYQIPNAYTADGPAGIRYIDDKLYSTWFPNMTLLASTWDRDLAYLYGQSVAAEAKLGGVHVWLAPGINIHRNPLNGRNFEYFSEDPYLTGIFGALITKGSEELGVAVSVKHYAANNQEKNRYGNSAQVSERALREIYLKAFEYIVKEGKPSTIMSSYNMINDEYVASSYNLITEVLKKDFGFNGLIFSDWGAHASHTEMMLAGNTIKSANPNHEELVMAYQNGIITREILENNAKTVIEFLLKIGVRNN